MKEGKNAQTVSFLYLQYTAMEKSNKWYVLEVKVTDLLVFSTAQVTDQTDFSFSRVEKKWSHTWYLV